jgi:hypothetical protein
MARIEVKWADCSKQHLFYRIFMAKGLCKYFYRVPVDAALKELAPYYLNPETEYEHISESFLDKLLAPHLGNERKEAFEKVQELQEANV